VGAGQQGAALRWRRARGRDAQHLRGHDRPVRAEEALRESERFLASIIDNIPRWCSSRTPATCASSASIEPRTGAGLLADELVGQEDQGLAPADESAFFASVERQVVLTGQTIEVPEEASRPASRAPDLSHNEDPIFDEHGQARYVLGLSDDITDLKMAEEARRESEERYHHIIDTITDYVMSVRSRTGGRRAQATVPAVSR